MDHPSSYPHPRPAPNYPLLLPTTLYSRPISLRKPSSPCPGTPCNQNLPWLEGFPGGTSGKEPACQCRRCKRLGLSCWVATIPWRRNSSPRQYSCLENPVDRGAWWVNPSSQRLKHGVTPKHKHKFLYLYHFINDIAVSMWYFLLPSMLSPQS